MLALARTGAEEALWLSAARQTQGRGRQGRAWSSPAGNVSASTLVRLRPSDPPAPTLALVAAVSVGDVVGTFLRSAPGGSDGLAIKWPNDLLLHGAKLAGILLERADDAIVIGIGVNLAQHPALSDRPTTSLAAHDVGVDPAVFVETLAEAFARWLQRWRWEGLAPIRDRWLAMAHPIGTALTARLPDGQAIDALFDGLDHDGALILRLAGGERRVIHAGDVFLI
ncbi:biotin--[acetyl-CoA-carboxylase] ligase [Sphingomonas jinjuensis]|uniref:biotin--[acetyl-CoA-carboxylase] ligase n=1 Tax=Sphingomonas jinjuensis TaxID=535907 RepID=UPI001FEA0475